MDGVRRHCHSRRALLVISMLALSVQGCDRARELFEHFTEAIRSGGHSKKGPLSDHERILRKFGAPRERLGVGKAVRTENGIRYNRKWNYYYSGRPGKKPLMRTVYFVDEAFTGSTIHGPDGTVRKEEIRFAY
ncbi:MAG: hypothetical protein NT045_09155 [Candidatus Aureabacteria bacterium]|nr:hypothetical protein [Candidatus Auribacterota bacterium]